MSLSKKLAFGGAALLIAMASALILTPAPQVLADDPLSGTFSGTGSGWGTYEPGTGEVSVGSITVHADMLGPLTGAFDVDMTYNPVDKKWFGIIGVVNGTLTVDGVDHPALFFGICKSASITIDDFPACCPVCQYSITFDGYFAVLTLDSSHICIYGTFSGSGSGNWSWNDAMGEWTATLTVSGTWTGTPWHLLSLPVFQPISPGGNVVTYTGPTGTVIQLSPNVTCSGNILVAQYDGNPLGTPPWPALGKYIEVDGDISPYCINWPVELRVYYTDAEVAAASIDESRLRMCKWDGSNWVKVQDSGIGVDANGKYVWARLTSFSQYAPMQVVDEGGGGCFIATAAYGSYLDDHVKTLRDFRDQYLVTNPVGSALVTAYYKLSPPVAEFIDEHPALRPVVRVGLLPAVGLSTVAVSTTLAEKIAIAGLLALISICLAVWLSRRRGKGSEYS